MAQDSAQDASTSHSNHPRITKNLQKPKVFRTFSEVTYAQTCPQNRPKINKKTNQITSKNPSPVLDAFWDLFFKDLALFGEPLRGQLASIF